MDNYSLMKELEFANYNTEANKQGWSYDFITKFINNHELTKEQLDKVNTNSPALESFITITPEMKKAKIVLEETTTSKLEAMDYKRGMTN